MLTTVISAPVVLWFVDKCQNLCYLFQGCGVFGPEGISKT